MAEEVAKPIEVFYSYDHQDEELRQELEKHLSILKRRKIINTWHSRMIYAGMERIRESSIHLNTAHIILLLVSSDFIASDYCYGIEVRRAMERQEMGEAYVIPIILRPVEWDGAPFSKLHALPKDGKPVTIWSDRDSAFSDITKGIRDAVRNLPKPFVDNKSNTFTVTSQARPSLDGTTKVYRYDVVLSYASEDRVYAEALADSLRTQGVKVFCYSQDMDQETMFALWGKSLERHLFDIYQNQSRYCVLFLSQHYAAKKWTTREREVALTRAISEQQDYILPIRLDDTEIPDISPNIVYIRWNKVTVESIARVIVEKLREVSQMLPYKY